jgi:hypothetical protein
MFIQSTAGTTMGHKIWNKSKYACNASVFSVVKNGGWGDVNHIQGWFVVDTLSVSIFRIVSQTADLRRQKNN